MGWEVKGRKVMIIDEEWTNLAACNPNNCQLCHSKSR